MVILLYLLVQAPLWATRAAAQKLVGSKFDYTVKPGDTLADISSRFGVPIDVLREENDLKSGVRLKSGRNLTVDNRHIAPAVLNDGIVVNVPQRLLFLMREGAVTRFYPVALGRPSWQTRLGDFRVTRMKKDPTWVVPRSIQAEMERSGKDVIDCMGPGPDNPLGRFAIYLTMPGYLIHGTIAPLSIYHFTTHGCIRLRPEGIADLFERVKVGDQGSIVYITALLANLSDGRIFAEVDRDVYHKGSDPNEELKTMAERAGLTDSIDWAKASRVARRADGIAHQVDRGAISAVVPGASLK